MKTCIVRGEKKYSGKSVVENPSLECSDKMLKRAKCHVDVGILEYTSLVQVDTIMKETHIEHRIKRFSSVSTNSLMQVHLEKKGRPSKVSSASTRSSQRNADAAPKFKERKYVSAPHL